MKIMPTNLKIEENDNKSFNSFLKILKLVIFQTQNDEIYSEIERFKSKQKLR